MSHVQQQILEGVRAALDAAAIVPAGHVFLDRIDPLESSELPALLVEEAPTGEVVNPQTVNGMEQRTYTVLVTAAVAHGTNYAIAARALGSQVEQVLGGSGFAVPKPGRARIDASRMNFSGAVDRPMAGREQAWSFTYFTRRGAPETAY